MKIDYTSRISPDGEVILMKWKTIGEDLECTDGTKTKGIQSLDSYETIASPFAKKEGYIIPIPVIITELGQAVKIQEVVDHVIKFISPASGNNIHGLVEDLKDLKLNYIHNPVTGNIDPFPEKVIKALKYLNEYFKIK